jgi:hypothetical protein
MVMNNLKPPLGEESLAIVIGILIPGAGHIISNHIRRGIVILVIMTLLALLPNTFSFAFLQIGDLLAGFQLLSQEATSEYYNISQFLNNSFFHLFLLPSIAFWIWQVRDLIHITKKKQQLFPHSKKKTVLVITGSSIFAIGAGGAICILNTSIDNDFTVPPDLKDIEAFLNEESNRTESILNQTLQSTTYFLIYMNYAIYLQILFIIIATIGIIVVLFVILKTN